MAKMNRPQTTPEEMKRLELKSTKTIDSIMAPVVSSNIQAIGYIPKKKELYVDFSKNSRYMFQDVDPGLFDEFQNAPSKGKFFAATVRGKFKTIKLVVTREEEKNV